MVSAPRFGGEGGTHETPGPGHYSNDDLNGWFKRTYNMIFTEWINKWINDWLTDSL